MDKYIALLLLVMPGFVARKIYKQTSNIREDLNTFEETMYCLLDSALIILVLFRGLAAYGVVSLDALLSYFDDMRFIAAYGFVALAAAFVFGLLTGWLREKYNWCINKIRAKKGMAQLVISQDVLDEFLLADGMNTNIADGTIMPRLIEIYKDGKFLASGWLQLGNMKRREFLLDDCSEGINGYFEKNKKMPPVKGCYVDGRLGLTIKEYDLTGLNSGKR